MKPLAIEQWDNSLQGIVDDMQGEPINIHRLMANHPALLKAWWPFRLYTVKGGDLEQRDCELVILRVAVLTETWYEWAAHVVRGLAAGLSRKEIDRVAAGPQHEDWNSRDQQILVAVDELVDERRISPKAMINLSEHLSQQQILDLVSLQGVYTNLACMLHTWDVEVDVSVREQLPDDVTEESFQALLAANRH